jgi:hypothetical protein
MKVPLGITEWLEAAVQLIPKHSADGAMRMRTIFTAVLLCAAVPASGQTPSPAAPASDAQAQLRFQPVTRPVDPVGIIYAAPVPGGCVLVFGADRLPNGANTSQGGVFVPGQGCPRAVAQNR